MERLYISYDNLSKAKEQTGQALGGKYVARVQTGVEKDGSPQYRYFRSQADYNKYLAQQRDAKKQGKDLGQGSKVKTGAKGSKKQSKDIRERLKAKLKKEQEESSTKTKGAGARKRSKAKAKKRSLFSGGKEVSKSMPLYLGEEHE